MVKAAVDAIFGLWRRVLEEPVEEVVLRLNLLLLLLFGSQDPNYSLLLRILCTPMLFSRNLTVNRWMWTAVACVSVASTISYWFGQDNHKFLMTYWTLACCLAVWSRNTASVLALSGRLLIALTFSFALFWKLFGGQLLSGEFFEVTFLIDGRFEPMARLGGVSGEALIENRDLAKLLRLFPSEAVAGTLQSSERLPTLAAAMGWLTVLIEAAVAAGFWLRFWMRDLDVHNWLLMVFCVATYSLAPVIGFGFLLVTMGLAQCNLEHRDSRHGYLWTFILVQFATFHTAGAAYSLLE